MIGTLWVGMRAEDAAQLFGRMAAEAQQAVGRDGAFEVKVEAEPNAAGPAIDLVFNNDDMERDEMTGRVVVDWD